MIVSDKAPRSMMELAPISTTSPMITYPIWGTLECPRPDRCTRRVDDDAVSNDAGTQAAWCAAGDLAVEDQAHLVWPTDVQVLADHLFKKKIRPVTG